MTDVKFPQWQYVIMLEFLSGKKDRIERGPFDYYSDAQRAGKSQYEHFTAAHEGYLKRSSWAVVPYDKRGRK